MYIQCSREAVNHRFIHLRHQHQTGDRRLRQRCWLQRWFHSIHAVWLPLIPLYCLPNITTFLAPVPSTETFPLAKYPKIKVFKSYKSHMNTDTKGFFNMFTWMCESALVSMLSFDKWGPPETDFLCGYNNTGPLFLRWESSIRFSVSERKKKN